MKKGGIGFYGGYWQVYYGSGKERIQKCFKNEQDALTFHASLIVQDHENRLDHRDYQRDRPLGFDRICDKFVEYKRVKHVKSWKKYGQRLRHAAEYFGGRNVKTIDYPELDEMLIHFDENGVPYPTQKLCMDTIRTMFNWLRKKRLLKPDQLPQEYPKVKYEMGYRKIVDLETRDRILHQIHTHEPFRAYLAIRWLSTYISIRPGELLQVKEGNFDLSMDTLHVTHTKTNRHRIVPLTPEDASIVRQLPRGFPEMYFFRHEKNRTRAKAGQRFGNNYLWGIWKRACNVCGVVGVDLYGGTRHSTTVALRQTRTPEQIKRATMHRTNRAFERYFQVQMDELREVYAETKPVRKVLGDFCSPRKAR